MLKKRHYMLGFIIIFISISSISQFSIAGAIDDPIIDVNVLSVSLGSFQDTTLGDGSGKLKAIPGGYDLSSFENLGEYSRDLSTNKILYYARVKFGFEVNVWTTILYNNIFPNINLNKKAEYPFLSIAYWKHIADWAKWMGGYKLYDKSYTAQYKEIDFGSIYNRHNYDGTLPISITINPGMKFSGEIYLDGSAFTVPQLTSDIVSVKIADMRGGECGSYEDYYSDQDLSEGSATLTVLDPTISGTSQKIVDWLNDHDLGYQKRGDVAYDSGASIQQAIRDLSYKGDVFPDTTISNTLDLDLPVQIQPEVKKFREYIDFNYGHFRYFTCCGDIMEPSVDGYSVERDVSVHVYNQFIHYDLELEADFFMTCQFEGAISQSFLDDPNLHISDMLWDTAILGSHKVDVGLTIEQNWLTYLIWIIVIIVIISVAYLVYRKYKSKKKTRGK